MEGHLKSSTVPLKYFSHFIDDCKVLTENDTACRMFKENIQLVQY